jgi:uncharacterized membrane protein
MHTTHHGQIISDGLFHSLTVITLVIGAIMLWLAGHPSDIEKGKRSLAGGILMGGGVFNLAEGMISHHILQIHHVKQGDPNEFLYDLAFLASGFILLFIGIMIKRSGEGSKVVSLNS